MNLFLEILRATAYLASITRSVLYAIWWWKEYKQNGERREKEIARLAPGYQFECTCVARVPEV